MCAKIWIAQFQNMKDCAFSLQNNKIIDILSKKFQENKKPIRHRCGLVKCGGAKGIRTPDLLNAIQTRYQLRHDPTSFSLFCSHILQHFHDIDKRFFATFVSP